MKTIQTKNAPEACGAYSQAIRSGNLLFCAGQIGLDPHTNKLVEGETIDQALQVIHNISAILESEWLTIKNVVKTSIFLADIDDWAWVNEVYAKYFTHKPARSTVAVAGLPAGSKVEIEVIAEYNS